MSYRPLDAATPIAAAKREIDEDGRQKANRRLNQGIDALFARQALVKTHPRDPDDDACADDDENQARAARDVWPDENAEHSIEHQGGEEAAPKREAALERGAACALGSRGRWRRAGAVGFFVMHVSGVGFVLLVVEVELVESRGRRLGCEDEGTL